MFRSHGALALVRVEGLGVYGLGFRGLGYGWPDLDKAAELVVKVIVTSSPLRGRCIDKGLDFRGSGLAWG